jgi:hypothetical protein
MMEFIESLSRITLGRLDKEWGSMREEGKLKYFRYWNLASYLCSVVAQGSDIRELVKNIIR